MGNGKQTTIEGRMVRFSILLILLVIAVPSLAAKDRGTGHSDLVSTRAPEVLKDLYYGEVLYDAFQGNWFDAIARLDTELGQYQGLDEPGLDTLHHHINSAEFAVGDFELAYRMHNRAGRAIQAVIEGDVTEPVRNEAIYHLARLYFQKDQPVNALHAIERIQGAIPDRIRDEIAFLRAQILMANGRFTEATEVLQTLQGAKNLEGFVGYNMGIALMKQGKEPEGRQYLDQTGQLSSQGRATMAIKDKSNLTLGYKLLEDENNPNAKLVLDRVRLSGPFSNQALLGSGWADVSQGHYDRALVPWSLLVERELTDPAVQEGMLALPYAYGKLKVHSRAARLYGVALEAFGAEIDKLSASIKSIREGHFLKALVREELKQDANWVVRLRSLPETPETYYLLQLMASHAFQDSLKNYLDLEQLRQKMSVWASDLDAFEELIQQRRAYYQPLLPTIDREFRRLDSQMRFRLEQRQRIAQRLEGMLVAPRPDYLATANERVVSERVALLEAALADSRAEIPAEFAARIKRLRGVLDWSLQTEYDNRFTQAYTHLQQLDELVNRLKAQYRIFVRTRQAATQSYEGYEDTIRRQRILIRKADKKVSALMARQGHLIEVMAVEELTRRRERLAEYQIKARFALADSFDRATNTQAEAKVEP